MSEGTCTTIGCSTTAVFRNVLSHIQPFFRFSVCSIPSTTRSLVTATCLTRAGTILWLYRSHTELEEDTVWMPSCLVFSEQCVQPLEFYVGIVLNTCFQTSSHSRPLSDLFLFFRLFYQNGFSYKCQIHYVFFLQTQ